MCVVELIGSWNRVSMHVRFAWLIVRRFIASEQRVSQMLPGIHGQRLRNAGGTNIVSRDAVVIKWLLSWMATQKSIYQYKHRHIYEHSTAMRDYAHRVFCTANP